MEKWKNGRKKKKRRRKKKPSPRGVSRSCPKTPQHPSPHTHAVLSRCRRIVVIIPFALRGRSTEEEEEKTMTKPRKETPFSPLKNSKRPLSQAPFLHDVTPLFPPCTRLFADQTLDLMVVMDVENRVAVMMMTSFFIKSRTLADHEKREKQTPRRRQRRWVDT